MDISTQLLSCDTEPIHIPGKIQQHGYLIAVNKNDFTITYISENVAALLQAPVSTVLAKPVTDIFSASAIQLRNSHLLQLKDFVGDETEEKIAPLNVKINDLPYFLLAHRSGSNLVMEFEPADASLDLELQRLLGASVSQILDTANLTRSLQNAAKKVKEMIGYERVMVYRFWEDGHGEVIAEELNEGLEPFMGLHYPASDIPKQARELYKITLTRIIVDASGTPVNIVAAGQQLADTPLDLTHSTLRAVSPVHTEYLRNMGVAASFSISLVVNNKLWGLIACHNATLKFIDYKAREGAKLIGQILSSSIEFKTTETEKEEARAYAAATTSIINSLQLNDDIPAVLTAPIHNLLGITAARGAALLFDKKIYLLGETPTQQQVVEIAAWLKHHPQQVYATDNLAAEYPAAESFAPMASGLLACSVSKDMGEYLMWFKPEIIQTVTWAGDPVKPESKEVDGQYKISPRHSFAAWRQQIKGYAEGWSRAERTAVLKLREDIIQVINQKANQIRLLNEKLQEAYDELDTFSFTISHDLKTPLSSVKNYTEILLEEHEDFPTEVKDMLGKIIKGSEKMNNLINEVLAYSRIGRKEVIKEEVDMAPLLEEIKKETLAAFKNIPAQINIAATPPVWGDKTMVYQVFSNLLSNAVKYAGKKEQPLVTIDAEEFPHEVIYKISDNGIGMDISFGNQIFEIFKRLNNVSGYEGSGVGLSIVKRIIEKHHGKIWYESQLGIGTIFYLSFNKSNSDEK